MDALAFLDEELAALTARDLFRENVSLDGPTGPTVVRAGRTLRNFSANDYLALAADSRVRWGAAEAALRFGGGAGATGLLGGDLPIHRELEAALALLKGTEAALLFGSGTQANLGTIAALVGEGDGVFSDALNHASIVDGVRLSRAERRIYRHLDLNELEGQLRESRHRRKLIVTETVFSMDGDLAPLAALVELAERFGAILMVDEAHATGLFGEGAGLCRELGLSARVPVQLGTLGKALGAAGAYVAGERRLTSYLQNRARSYIFTTAPAPAACGAALAALRIVQGAEGAERRRRVFGNARALAQALRAADLPLIGGQCQLLAVPVAEPARAMEASAALERAGFLVRAVRPPTVPEGGSRLRLCLSAGHTAEDIEDLAQALQGALRDRPSTPSALQPRPPHPALRQLRDASLSEGKGEGGPREEQSPRAEQDLAARQAALKASDFRSLWHPFTQQQGWFQEEPLIVERGEGSYLFDVEGRRYLDGVSSLWATLHGHQRPELSAAIAEQLTRVAHSTLLGLSGVPAIELAEALIRRAPQGLTRVFFSDSGSTAVEVALKIAFQFFRQNGAPQRHKFLAFGEAYHGDTIGSVSTGGIDLFHDIFRQLLFPVVRAPAPASDPDANAVCALIGEHSRELAAVVIEPLVQGAAGMLVQPEGYLRKVREACSAHGVLLIADEVATGFGRTGTFFAVEQEGVRPDLLCLGKGISGGYLPLAATLATEELFEGFLGAADSRRTFFHGHTYTGNALACAAALASLRLFESDRTLERLQPKIARLNAFLDAQRSHPHVVDVRQCGFMAGIELGASREPRQAYPAAARVGHQVILEARRRGVILRPLGDVVVLMPPLSIASTELDELLCVTASAIDAVTSAPASV